jgi:hypothetical protein
MKNYPLNQPFPTGKRNKFSLIGHYGCHCRFRLNAKKTLKNKPKPFVVSDFVTILNKLWCIPLLRLNQLSDSIAEELNQTILEITSERKPQNKPKSLQ